MKIISITFIRYRVRKKFKTVYKNVTKLSMRLTYITIQVSQFSDLIKDLFHLYWRVYQQNTSQKFILRGPFSLPQFNFFQYFLF